MCCYEYKFVLFIYLSLFSDSVTSPCPTVSDDGADVATTVSSSAGSVSSSAGITAEKHPRKRKRSSSLEALVPQAVPLLVPQSPTAADSGGLVGSIITSTGAALTKQVCGRYFRSPSPRG